MSFVSQESTFINRIILPGNGRKYSGKTSKGLLWLCNSAGLYFPNHYIRKPSKSVILYAHGNGGSLGDFKSIVTFYATWFSMSVFAIEYPGYGPAEGEPSETTVNDNLYTAFQYLLQLGYPPKNIVLMGYSIGTGPIINLGASLCVAETPPGAIVTIAAFLSICDIVKDLKGSVLVSWLAGAIDNRWNSGDIIDRVNCPILFIHGAIDDVIPYSHSATLHENCSSQQKFIRLCEHATHTHFHEPVDTIEPISLFLAEMVRPQESAVIYPVAAVQFMCPQSVLEREQTDAEANPDRARNSSYTEVSLSHEVGQGVPTERSCVGSLVDWVTDWLPATFLLKNNVPEQFTRETGTARVDIDTENDWDGGGSSEELGRKGHSQRFFGEMILPGSNQTRDEFDLQQALDDADSCGNSAQLMGAGYDAIVNEAIQVLNTYYDAINQQDLFAAVSLLDDEVLVLFPEDWRNWCGADTAVGKFRNMFNAYPGIQGSIQIWHWQREPDNSVSLSAHCHFQCIQSNYQADREMMYGVKDKKIFLIDHKG